MADLHLLGIPMDLGAGRRGVDMGPSALRLARLEPALRELGHAFVDHGNVPVSVAEATASGDALPYADAIADACSRTYLAARGLPGRALPIFLGGDHAVAMGTVAGAARERTGLLWIDAHADLNTPASSPSGNVHGMPLAALLGEGDPRFTGVWGGGAVVRPEDVVFVGLRRLDAAERDWIQRVGLRAYTMTDLDRRGMAEVAAEAIDRLGHLPRLHVSFDADALDPDLAPGVGTPVPGGLSYREAHLLMEMLSATGRVTSLDLVEVNPILDVRNRTAEIMVEMTASLLGKSIL
jgi:arginase